MMKKNYSKIFIIGYAIIMFNLTFFAQPLQNKIKKQAGALREITQKQVFPLKQVKSQETIRGMSNRQEKPGKRVFLFKHFKGKIEIPEEVCEKMDEISVQQIETEYDKSRFKLMGKIHRFGPHGARFEKPLIVTLPYECPDDFPEEFINVYYYNAEKDRYEIVTMVSKDMENNTITVQLNHFSDYAPGTSSYSINEGSSPNSGYFSNNNEKVDTATGRLLIDRTDIDIKANGVNLNLNTGFSSDRYFWNYAQYYEKRTLNTKTEYPRIPEKTTIYLKHKEWESVLEEFGQYRFAQGWRFNLPEFNETDKYQFYYITEQGITYLLNNAIKYPFASDKTNQVHMLEGYRIYNTKYEKKDNDTFYSRVIEILPEKIVITCNIEKILYDWKEIKVYPPDMIVPIHTMKIPLYTYFIKNMKTYLPDGRIVEFSDSLENNRKHYGKVTSIKDSVKKNGLTYSYDTSYRLSEIMHTDGRYIKLNHGDNNIEINLFDKNDSLIKKVLKYNLQDNKLNSITLYNKEQDTEKTKTIAYNYDSQEHGNIKIKYPSGGNVNYNFNLLYSIKKTYKVSHETSEYAYNSKTIYFNGTLYFRKPFINTILLKPDSSYADNNKKAKKTKYKYYFTKNDQYTDSSTVDAYPDRNVQFNNAAITDNISICKADIYCNDASKDVLANWFYHIEDIYKYDSTDQYVIGVKKNYFTGHDGITKLTVNEYMPISCDYYEIEKVKHYSDANSSVSYQLEFDYDCFGQKIKEKDANGSITYYDYIYSHKRWNELGISDNTVPTVPYNLTLSKKLNNNYKAYAVNSIILEPGFNTDGWDFTAEIQSRPQQNIFINDPNKTNYNNKLHSLGLIRGVVKQQQNNLNQETYYHYDDNRNLVKTQYRKIDSNG